MMNKKDTDLLLHICLALRQGNLPEADSAWHELVRGMDAANAGAVMGEEVQLCLLTAMRCKQAALAYAWLEEKQGILQEILAAENMAAAGKDLLINLAFAVADKRLSSLQEILLKLMCSWLRAQKNSPLAGEFLAELMHMAARMLRRGWKDEARFLLALPLRETLRQKNISAWQNILGQLAMHFASYARWESFPRACDAYPELVVLLASLVRRSARKKNSLAERGAFMELALRSMRDLVKNISRSTMQEDMDIFHEWYQYLWQVAGEDPARKQRVLLLLQLTILYWQGTLPKTSRKQQRFVADLLEPSQVNEDYARLLASIL